MPGHLVHVTCAFTPYVTIFILGRLAQFQCLLVRSLFSPSGLFFQEREVLAIGLNQFLSVYFYVVLLFFLQRHRVGRRCQVQRWQ